MIFRLSMLVVVCFLGSVAYYAKQEPEPLPLLRRAGKRSLVLCAWTVLGFVVLTGIEKLVIDP